VSKLFVVLFAGCIDSYHTLAQYYNDLKRFGDFFSMLPDVDSNSLTVLHSDGSPPFIFTGVPNPTVGAGNMAGLQGALQSVAASAKTADRFVFVASNHGGIDNSLAYLWCWNSIKVYATDFAKACGAISAQRQAYVFGQCNSGGFITPLANSSRVILAGCGPNDVTYPTDDNNYDEFLLRVVENLENGERHFANVFAAAKAADTQKESPELSDPGGIGSDASLLTGP